MVLGGEMSDWNPKANEIFLKALDCESSESRQAYLDQACGSDKELRAQVESLLEADSDAASFLGRPIAGDRPAESAKSPRMWTVSGISSSGN